MPTQALIDSQSVKTTESRKALTWEKTKGVKRQIVTDDYPTLKKICADGGYESRNIKETKAAWLASLTEKVES